MSVPSFIVRNVNLIYSEAEILRRTWSEAPHLFQTNLPTPPDIQSPEHPRTLSNSPIPDRLQDQPSQTISASPLSSTAVGLVGTYSFENIVRVLGSSGGLGSGSSGVFARVSLAIEQSDQKIEIQQLFRRACCYSFAQLHKKGTSVGPIVQEIQSALPGTLDTRKKVTISFVSELEAWSGLLQRKLA